MDTIPLEDDVGVTQRCFSPLFLFKVSSSNHQFDATHSTEACQQPPLFLFVEVSFL